MPPLMGFWGPKWLLCPQKPVPINPHNRPSLHSPHNLGGSRQWVATPMLRLTGGVWGGCGHPRGNACPPPPLLLPQTPGMPVPQYPYGDGHLGTTPQGPQPRPQEDAWAPPATYGAQPRNAWTTAHGTPFGTDPHPAWGGGSGAASYPPPRDSKVRGMLCVGSRLWSDPSDPGVFPKTCPCLQAQLVSA